MNYGEDGERVLEHLARHIVSLPIVLENFVLKKPAQDTITHLRDAGLVTADEFAGQQILRLTRKGTSVIGAPKYRGTETPGSFAQKKHFAALWWCLQSFETRHRLTRFRGRDDQEQQTLDLFPDVKAAICYDGESKSFYRLFLPDPEKTESSDIVRQLRREVTRDGTVREWIEAGWYRFCILSQYPHHRREIEHTIRRDRKKILQPYLQAGWISLHYAPTDPINFVEALTNDFQSKEKNALAQ